MIAFPFFVTPEIVHTEETKLFNCDRCGRKDAEIYPQNTRYENECDNWVVLCEDCEADNDAYWEERWKEYYAGVM